MTKKLFSVTVSGAKRYGRTGYNRTIGTYLFVDNELDTLHVVHLAVTTVVQTM